MENYFIGIILLFFGAIFSLFFKKRKIEFITICSITASIFTIQNAIKVFIEGTKEISFNLGTIFQTVRFEMDYLGAFFVLFISVMSTLAVIYSKGYLKPYLEKGKDLSAHCVFLPLLSASMLLVATCFNGLFFLILWEMMSLSSFFLVIFEHEKKEVLKAGLKYLVFMHISVIFIILLFALLINNSSSLDFAQFREILADNPVLSNVVFMLGFIGFGIKAGFVPFHNWLSEAHPCAPSHVSGIMSGVMIKTGIYGILRIISLMTVFNPQIGYFVLIISVISALYGVIYAIGQHDLKKLLAYHSIENIGIIGLGLGLGLLGLAYNQNFVALLGFSGAILHILNHSIFKELLFLGAGSVYIKTHTRDIEILGGLIKKMPYTSILFLTGAVAICGLPPFNGFISEFLIYFSMLKGLSVDNIFMFLTMLLGLSGLALVGTLAILCFTKAFSIVFLGEARSENAKNVQCDNGISMILPMGILGCLCLLIGVFPAIIFNFILKITSIFVNVEQTFEIIPILQIISTTALCIIGAVMVLSIIKFKFEKRVENFETWGCGYNKVSEKMQYSASSYAQPFTSMIKPLFKKISDIKKPKTIFPKEAHFEQHIEDVEEVYFIKPVLNSIENFLTKFEKLQNGNIQQYIMYGLIFLIIAIIGVVTVG